MTPSPTSKEADVIDRKNLPYWDSKLDVWKRRGDITGLLGKFGASHIQWDDRMDSDLTGLAFKIGACVFTVRVDRYGIADREKHRRSYGGYSDSERRHQADLDRRDRQTWALIYYWLKNKLTGVELGLESIEEAFLGQAVVMQHGKGVRLVDVVLPAMKQAEDVLALPGGDR
jgi:hypothetical protein